MKKLVLIAAVIGIAGISWAASPSTTPSETGVSQSHGMHWMTSGHGHRHGMKEEKHAGQGHAKGHAGHGKMHGMEMSQHHAKMGCDESQHSPAERGHRHH